MDNPRIRLMATGLATGMFLAALDQTIVATALRTIGDDLNALTAQAWVTTAYMIAATLSTPLYGKLSDVLGRRPMYFTALGLFTLGSLLCGLAQSMTELAAFRAIQGLGGGGLISLAMIIIGDIMGPRQRARYQGIFSAMWGIASVVGPVVGGFFAGQAVILGWAGWRWIFLMNVPLALLCFWVIFRLLQVPSHSARAVRIDYWGAIALGSAMIPFLMVVEQGHVWGWTSPRVITLLTISALACATFVWVEIRLGADALIPLALLRSRNVSITVWVNICMGISMFGVLAGLPLYLQIAKGLSPTTAGLAMIPFSLGITFMSIFAGQIMGRTGKYYAFPILGAGLLIFGATLLLQLQAATSLWHVSIASTIFGLGLGGIMQPTIVALQNNLARHQMGVGTAAVMFFRQVGGAVGTAIFLSLLFGNASKDIDNAYASAWNTPEFSQAVAAATADGSLSPQVAAALPGPDVLARAGFSLDDTSFVNDLPQTIATPLQDGFANTISTVLRAFLGAMIAAFVLAWFLPRTRLREHHLPPDSSPAGASIS